MPLSSQLSLSTSPRSAAEARRWVGNILERLGRDDLVECTQLGVSELVTNAVLHGAPPISLRVRGTASHPRVEVTDSSTRAPLPNHRDSAEADSEDMLATFGRGLAIVGRSANAWGATIEPHGKIVWFEPATDLRDEAPEWVVDSVGLQTTEAVAEGAKPVTLLGIDLALYQTLGQQYAELRRELRLLSLGHQNDYPLAGNLTAMFANFERQFPATYLKQLARDARAGKTTTDITVRLMPESIPIFVTMSEMFDVADAFCRAERLLSLARTPEERAFNNWLLGELIRQLEGGEPQAWQGSARVSTAHQQRASSRVG